MTRPGSATKIGPPMMKYGDLALMFAAGLRLAHSKQENVRFS